MTDCDEGIRWAVVSAFARWALRRVVNKYGVRLGRFWDPPEGCAWARSDRVPVGTRLSGTGDMGIRFSGGARELYLAHPIDTMDVEECARAIHEVSHLVIGPESCQVDEGYILLAFEWRLCRALARHAPEAVGLDFLTEVNDYQEHTEIALEPRRIAGFLRTHRKERWWRAAEQRSRQLGLLDERMNPTWRLPNWSVGLTKSPRGWVARTA